jgi:Tol biopolymer transport system component
VDRNGVAEPIDTIPPGNYAGPRLSPDGQRVLVMADGDVWIYDMATGRPSRLTRDGMENQAGGYAEWDPTGTRIAYSSRRGGGREANVWIQSVDQSDAPRQLTDLQLGAHIDSWSLDGKLLAVHQHTPDQEANTLMIPMTGTNPEPVPFLQRDFFDGLSVFSPDGRYVAYYSGEARNASGLGDIQIRPYPGPGGQVTISVGGARGPIWAANGELFYRTLAGDRMMSVSVVTEPELLVGPPQVVFEELYPFASPTIYRADYDVTDDGERFLMLVDATTSAPQADQINVVLDWTMELLERVPVD